MIRTLLACLFFAASALHAEAPSLPPEALALLPATPLKPTKPASNEGSITEVESTAAPTKTVWRMQSPAKLEKSYNLSLSRTFSGRIEKDQVCLFVIQARAVEGATADGKGKISVAVQNTKTYKDSPLWKNWEVGPEWETSFFTFQSESDLPEGAGVAKINAGEARQTIEVADFQLYRFPVGFDIFKAPQMKKTYKGRELDASWRQAAEERIAKYRRGLMTVRVVDADGKPVEGAKVKVEMTRHLFGFGSSVDVNMLSGLGTTITPEEQARYRSVVDEFFSRIVPENGLRVGQIDGDSNPDKPWEADSRRRTGIAVQWALQWAKDRRISTRGHYLTWGYLEPWAAEEVKKGGPAGLLARYDRHFAHVLPFCDPYVEEWDAVNHPVPFVEADALYRVIGPDIHASLYSRIRAQTNKLLFVNEDAFNAERTDAFEKHVKHMIALGQTPDGSGFQSHFSDYSIPSIDEQWKVYQRFGALTKHLTVTEYDFQTLDDQLHADHLRDMLTLCFSHPQMTGFVIWGFWEKRHWRPTAAMFKADWTERPAVQVWRDLVKSKWWTKADLTTNAKGEVSVDGFFGWYDVTVEKDGKAAQLTPRHSSKGDRPVVTLK